MVRMMDKTKEISQTDYITTDVLNRNMPKKNPR